MPIKLEITEAELLAPSALNAVAAFLQQLAGGPSAQVKTTSTTHKVSGSGVERTVSVTEPVTKAQVEAPGGLGNITPEGVTVVRTDAAGSILENLTAVSLTESPIDPACQVVESAAAVFGGEAPKPAGAVAPTPPAPVAPVAPTAPASTAPVAPNQNSGIATDKAGLPWDRRIHSESKSINKTDGLWRAKRGRDESLTAGIEAELRAAMAVEVPKPGLDPSPTVDPAAAPVAPVAPTVTAPPAPLVSEQGSTTPKTLGELMVAAQALVASGKIASLDVVRATAAELGIVALPLLGTRPDMCEAVYNKLIAL